MHLASRRPPHRPAHNPRRRQYASRTEMTGLPSAREAMELRRRIIACVPGAVVATWGSTGREEMTRLSDLDVLCWNPDGEPLPELRVRHATYLHAWATANATDLHALLFARHAGPPGERAEQFRTTSRRLWSDERLRAREIYHLLITSIRVGTIFGSSLARPEKFTLGATRCWTVLAECGQLLAGRALEGEHWMLSGAWRRLVSSMRTPSARSRSRCASAGDMRMAMLAPRTCSATSHGNTASRWQHISELLTTG